MKVLVPGTRSATLPVSLDIAKANSNIEHDDSDDLLGLLLEAAIAEAENYTGRSLRSATGVKVGVEEFVREMQLPHYPVASIASVSYKSATGDDVVMPPSNYELVTDEESSTLYFVDEDFPETKQGLSLPITITYSVGYSDSDFPADIKKGILLIFSHNELYREDMPLKFNRSSRVALRPYRR